MKRIDVEVQHNSDSAGLVNLHLLGSGRSTEVCREVVDLEPGDEAVVYVVKKGEKVKGALGRLSKAARALRERYVAVLANTGADKYCHQAARDLDQLIIAAEVERVQECDSTLKAQLHNTHNELRSYKDALSKLQAVVFGEMTVEIDVQPATRTGYSDYLKSDAGPFQFCWGDDSVHAKQTGITKPGRYEGRFRFIEEAPKPKLKRVKPIRRSSTHSWLKCPECGKDNIGEGMVFCPKCSVPFTQL